MRRSGNLLDSSPVADIYDAGSKALVGITDSGYNHWLRIQETADEADEEIPRERPSWMLTPVRFGPIASATSAKFICAPQSD